MQDQPKPPAVAFQAEIEALVTKYDVQSVVGLPPHIVAEHMVRSLAVLQITVVNTQTWANTMPDPEPSVIVPHPQGIIRPH